MQVSQVDLKALGIDPLRGRAKEGTGWPENNRDEKWDWKYYCLTCRLEVKKAYLCKAERRLNKTAYSPTTPNWVFNRPPSLKPRCPQCQELDKLITKQQRIDWFKANIAKIYQEEQRLKTFQKKWKKFRKKHYDLLFNNNNHKIPRESLKYKDQDMWQCHINLLEYIEDYSGYFMPRSESTKENLKLVWELDHKWRMTRKQNEEANLMKNSGDVEVNKQNYARALHYYNRAIIARIDRSDLYLQRALLFFLTGQYSKCIIDCTIIISMIDAVHTQLKQSGLYVKAYYNRAKAKKFLSKLVDAKKDLQEALLVDEDDMDCKKLLSEINTLLLLLNNKQDRKRKDEFDVLFEGSLDFLQTAQDKTSHSESKLFCSLFKLLKEKDIYYKAFVNERNEKKNGIVLCLNYMRSKFKSLNTKEALKDIGKPGLDELFNIVNDIMIGHGNGNGNGNGNLKDNIMDIIEQNKKLISNNILYIFTLYPYMHSILQKESLKFATFMFKMTSINQCIQYNYVKPLMERFKKLNRKIKTIQTPILDNFILQCMVGLFGDDADDIDDNEKGININETVCEMYNNNEILYEWMVKYIKYCNPDKLKHSDKSDKNYCCAKSFENLFMIFDGVKKTISYSKDNSFYMLYNPTKQKQFGVLISFLNKLQNIDINKIDDESYCEEFDVQLRITGITLCVEIINCLCNKEQGRKWLLQNNNCDVGISRNILNILILIKNKEKYTNKLRIDNNLGVYIDHIFRKLIQQEQDNQEQEEIEEKERKEREEKEAKEKIEKEKEKEKEREEKENKEKEKESEEKENKEKAKGGDLDGLSDEFDEEEYLRNIELDLKEEKKRKKKEKKKKKKKKKDKKNKKNEDDDEFTIKPFVSQRDPATFDKSTLKNVFGDTLSTKEIEVILSIAPDK